MHADGQPAAVRRELAPREHFHAAAARSAVLRVLAVPAGDPSRLAEALDAAGLPEACLGALGALTSHLEAFGLQHILSRPAAGQSPAALPPWNLEPFRTAAHVRLTAQSIRDLELFANLSDGREEGSLLWFLSRFAATTPGTRLLRTWLRRPLVDQAQIEARLEAVEALRHGDDSGPAACLEAFLRRLRSRTGGPEGFRSFDLEAAVALLHYRKITPRRMWEIGRAHV